MGLDVHVYRVRKDHVTKDFQVIEDQEVWDDLGYYSEGGTMEKPSIENLFWWGYEGRHILYWLQDTFPKKEDMNGVYIRLDKPLLKSFKKFVLPSMEKESVGRQEAENFVSYAKKFFDEKDNDYELFICADW